jgi:hypothetical protein
LSFKVEEGEEGQKTELPALRLIKALGYTYKPNFEINRERPDHRQAILYGRLKEKIKEFTRDQDNNRLTDDEVKEAIIQIHEDAFPANLKKVKANKRLRIKLFAL